MLTTRLAAVFIGAGIGGCARYTLSLALNPLLVGLPLGTLVANLLGGYLAGLAAGYFLFAAQLPEEWRLLAMTGFLGGLTTFSAFSVEMVALLQAGRTGLALGGIALHVGGSLALTALGLLSVRALVH
ncbi:MAG: fluoride efflux transporter CrcB [Steroidobacteraceae bacterium]